MAQEPLSHSELRHYTNLWCRSKGIHATDLETHSQIDDIMLLLAIKDEFGQEFTKSEQAVWGQKWGWVYNRKFPLKKKYRLALEQLCLTILERRQACQKARDKIKNLRHV
jgi:hypothetical protein